jgi:beta-N-acetylhexosaminidase
VRRPRGVRIRLVIGSLAVIVAACIPSAPAATSSPARSTSTPPPTATPNPTSTPAPTPSTAPTSSPSVTSAPTTAPTQSETQTASCSARVLASLTETQRIGQLFAVGLAHDRFTAAERAAIRTYGLGSWWFDTKTSVGTTALRKVADAVQAEATDAATGGIGFFIAANQEGGLIQALSGPGFDRIPSAVTQGTWSTARLRDAASRWGRQLLKAGVNLDFAPVADVVPKGTASRNAPIGELKREYGYTPSVAADHVQAFIEGMTAAGVTTTAKHFPGLGRVVDNTDFSSGVVDTVTTRDDPDLEPFRRAVEAGVPAVMLSLATYRRIDPDRLAAFSWPIIGGILEDDLGFRGIVMSDSLSAEAVSSIPVGTRAVRFLDEGGDLIVVRPVDMAITVAKAVATHARESAWFRDRIDNAVLHVLRAKEAAGLLPCAP